jgi:malate dehydrogenase
MAYAGAEFAAKVIRAVRGEKGLVTPTYVNLSADAEGASALTKELGEELAYFSANVELGVGFIISLLRGFSLLTP